MQDPYIYASCDGILTFITEQAKVDAGDTLYEIAPWGEQQVILYIDEYDINRVELGQNVNITTTQGSHFTGVVSEISYNGVTAEATDWAVFPIRINVDKSIPLLGAHLQGQIIVFESNNVVVVPQKAIYLDEEGNSYIIMKNNEKKFVKTGEEDDTYVEIVLGVSVGDEVLVGNGVI